MQTHGGTAAASAMESPQRQFTISLQVDWNRNGQYNHPLSDLSAYVDEISTDRSLRGSAPEELLLIEGSAAAELVATIHGDLSGLSFAAVFSPYNLASPLHEVDMIGVEVRYRLGVETPTGTVFYPQFVGMVRTISPDRSNGSVEITALDRAELLRRPVMTPTWAVYSRHERTGSYATQLVHSHWLIDHCLRGCDISPTPYRPATREEMGLADNAPTGPQLWVTGNGAALPSVGWPIEPIGVTFPTDAGGVPMYLPTAPVHPNSPEPTAAPFAIAATGSPTAEYLQFLCADRNNIYEEGTHYAGFTLVTTGQRADYYRTGASHTVMAVYLGARYLLTITIGLGKVRTQFRNQNGGPTLSSPELTIPSSGTHHRVDVIWDPFRTAGARVYLRVGSVSTTGFASAGSALPFTWVDDSSKGRVLLSHRTSLSDIYYASRSTAAPPDTSVALASRAATHAAVLDHGRNRITGIVDRSGEDAWDIITDVAAAEYGAVFWDESGIFRFWNRDRIASLQSTVVRTLSLDDVSGLRITNSLDSIRNIWTVRAKKYRSHDGVIYSSGDVDEFVCPGGTLRTYTVAVDRAVAVKVGLYSRRNLATWRIWAGPSTYVVQWLKNGEWVEDDNRASPGVEVRAYFNYRRQVVVELWNGYSEPARLATNDGDAAVQIGGTLVREEAPTLHTRKHLPSITKYDGRNLELSGDWHQDAYDAAALVNSMITKTSEPTPATDAVTIAGDPRLQLGDCIRIADPDGIGTVNLQIHGIRRTISRSQGLSDTLAVEIVPA